MLCNHQFIDTKCKPLRQLILIFEWILTANLQVKKKSKIQPNFSLVEQKLSKIVCRINDAPPDGTDLIVMNKPHIP